MSAMEANKDYEFNPQQLMSMTLMTLSERTSWQESCTMELNISPKSFACGLPEVTVFPSPV